MFARRPALRVPVTATLSAGAPPPDEALRAIVQHVLFMHQQIPCAYAELGREVEAMAESGRRGSLVQRKAAKLFAATEALLAPLAVAFAKIAEHSEAAIAAIVLGPSIASPRLAYLLRLDVTGATPPPRDAARRVLRAIAAQGIDLTAVDSGLCRLHILLAAPRHAQLPAPHFRARPGLQLKLQRAHVATVTVHSSQAAALAAAAEPAAAEGDGPPAWLDDLVSGYVQKQPPPTRKRPRPSAADTAAPMDADSPLPPAAIPAHGGESAPPPLPPPPSLPPPLPQPLPPPAKSPAKAGEIGLATGEAGQSQWVWWQSTALIKGFRLPGGRVD